MESCDAALQTEVLFKVPELAEKFFPSVTVFGQCRIRIFFFQWNDVRRLLLVSVGKRKRKKRRRSA
jgi:hypothetical protein